MMRPRACESSAQASVVWLEVNGECSIGLSDPSNESRIGGNRIYIQQISNGSDFDGL